MLNFCFFFFKCIFVLISCTACTQSHPIPCILALPIDLSTNSYLSYLCSPQNYTKSSSTHAANNHKIYSKKKRIQNRGNSLRRVKNGNKWRAREISLDQKPTTNCSAGGGSNSNSNLSLNRLSANLTTADVSPALIAQANWTFVERLLKVRREFIKCLHRN